MKQLIPKIPTIAITGSAGKTTTKEMISSILETKFKIFKSKRNRNFVRCTKNHAKMIKPWHQAVVLEFGMGKGNTGKMHCSYIQPNIGIITNVGSAHFGMFGNNIILTAKAKSELIKYMKPEGILYINNDDVNSKLLQTKDFKGKIFSVGIKNNSDYQAVNIKYLAQGMSFQVKLYNKSEVFFIPSFGRHNVINALFAIAVCHYLKLPPSKMKSGLKKYKIPVRRINRYELPNGLVIIDDSYSANPEATKAAIDVLVELGKNQKKVVIIGSMLELGKYTVKGHMKVGKYLARNKVDKILTFGNEARCIKKGAIKAGFTASNILLFRNRDKMHAGLQKLIEPNTVILLKGSKLMEMHKTLDYLLSVFSK
ncbi:UDP-N-acetylmuramoyl-tripeptide--D-alanyl-D-alanine ligase [Candidatus Contubernalis alkaliaceticus]|uniref:UDP-N-acetylmuramoyl-tripeptide--D-alanyl-D- alanine ligase n=1 Tax=Candidatus Contubernalis alkaliaceticus TaxID=338645 RepID=UPI001F4BF9A6|nr:UDP-N-acetylmuramoyl-tripeptide--D-alanyl-D-alanine ligase [Candidatus Contubernalis alkalaceticus]UNC92315.1 UDP-N-acetylmuramoyl-tripeptide--D-alanyl-D-alanine ligase [Candidatus Contubernalis alkalaceticus]